MHINIIALLASVLILSVTIAAVTGENVAANMFKPFGIVIASGVASYVILSFEPNLRGIMFSFLAGVIVIPFLIHLLYKIKIEENLKITAIYITLHVGWFALYLALEGYWRYLS